MEDWAWVAVGAKMPPCPPVGLKGKCIPDPRNAPCVLEGEGDGVMDASELRGAELRSSQSEQDLLVGRVTPEDTWPGCPAVLLGL